MNRHSFPHGGGQTARPDPLPHARGRRPRLRMPLLPAMVACLALSILAVAGCSSNGHATTSSTTSAGSTAPSSSTTSSSSAGSTGTAAGKSQLCEAGDQLKTSVTVLDQPQPHQARPHRDQSCGQPRSKPT